MSNGKVYIASMNMRGTRAKCDDDNTTIINVTSAQRKDSIYRVIFSPMTECVGGYKGFWCFENYWQSGKVFQGLQHGITTRWWKSLKEPKRRYPKSKGYKVLYSTFNGNQYDYIESRKKIYVPEYYDYIRYDDLLNEMRSFVKNGGSLTIQDFDGPRDNDNNPICMEVNLKLLKDKINDERHPFGHGYIIAAACLGITPDKYLK